MTGQKNKAAAAAADKGFQVILVRLMDDDEFNKFHERATRGA